MCLKESWRYCRRENGDTYEDSLTRHIHEIRLIKNRSRVRSWRMEWYTVLLVCVYARVCMRAYVFCTALCWLCLRSGESCCLHLRGKSK